MSTSILNAAPDAIRSRDGRPIDRIVIHTMEGTLAGTIRWFQTPVGADPNRKVATAAHYLIGKDGSIVQMVPDVKKALHAGSKTEAGWNDRSLGIEHEGYARDVNHPTALLESSALVTAILCRKFGIPVDRMHIIGHSEVPGVDHTDPGDTWPWDAYMALVRGATLTQAKAFPVR